jgi:hypothetical protein
MPPGGPPDGITAAPLFVHLAPENCGSSQPLTLVSLSGGLGRLAQDGEKISNECFAKDALSDGSAKKFEQLVFRQIERPRNESSAWPPGKTDFYLSKPLDP